MRLRLLVDPSPLMLVFPENRLLPTDTTDTTPGEYTAAAPLLVRTLLFTTLTFNRVAAPLA